MILRVIVFVSALTIAGSALAQQTSSGAADRIAMQIGRLVLQLEQQADQIKSLHELLVQKDAKIKELEEKGVGADKK